MERIVPVYKVINNNLVRVQGDKRDPKRRYARIAGPNGTYDKEFTDEEEKQRDLEEARWKAEQPQREAEAKQSEEKFKQFRESLYYEERTIAFLDVLGWSCFIEQSRQNSELIQKLGIALNSLENHRQIINAVPLPNDLRITHFSDTIVLSIKKIQTLIELHLFIQHIKSIVHSLLTFGFLVRGSITSGLLIHRDTMIYGPALIKAYKLESEEAKWPRVLLENELAKELQISSHITGPCVMEQSGTLIGYVKDWRIDKQDKKVFFDYLQPIINMPDTTTHPNLIRATLAPVHDIIINGLQKYQCNPEIHKKYKCMASYFNEVLQEYSITDLSSINY